MQLLVNALSGIGDALMFSPALKILHNKLPNYHIDMLVMYKSVRELYQYNPYIRNIHFIDFLNQSKIKSLKELMKLRKNDYFISINVYPSNRMEYNVINFLEGAKKRIANNYIKSNFFRLEFLNNIRSNEVRNVHNVLQNINLLRNIVDIDDGEIGNLEIHITDDEINLTRLNLQNSGIELSRPIIGFHCGSSILKNHINKRWDKYKFAELGCRLIHNYNAQILLFGNETELNSEVNELMQKKGFITATKDFRDSILKMKFCNLFISNDTAFMHSASALNIPIVAIFGYTNYKELHPWKTRYEIVRKELDCSPCFYNSPSPVKCKWRGRDEFKCMKEISVDEVYNAANKLLST